MTELVKDSNERSPGAAASAASLMQHYGFDLGNNTFGGDTCGGAKIAQLLLDWQTQYSVTWIRLATIEALYQGRYKAISVAQILALWQRRSQPVYHFNHEFERLICDRLPQTPAPEALSTQAEPFSARSTPSLITIPFSGFAVPLPGVVSTPALHHLDAMEALRTLHTDATTEQNEPSQVWTDSDPLRSADEPPQRWSQEPSGLAQNCVNLALGSSVDAEPIGTNQPANDTQIKPATAQIASIVRILQQLDDQELHAQTRLASIGQLPQTLKPKLSLHLAARYQPIWLTDTSGQPIHQFSPTPEASDFHEKLKSVAQLPDGMSERLPDGAECPPPLA